MGKEAEPYEKNKAYEDWKESVGKKYDEVVEQRLASEPTPDVTPYVLFSPEWVKKFEEEIQKNEEYQKLAKGWKGSVILQVLAKPEIGFGNDLFVFMDIYNGDCYSVRLVPKEVGLAGDYVIEGKYDTWKDVVNKKLDVMVGLMTGKLKLAKREKLSMIVKYATAAKKLVTLAVQVGCRFPEELNAEELEKFKVLFKDLGKFGI